MPYRFITTLLLACLANTCPAQSTQPQIELTHLDTIDVPGFVCEIVDYCACEQLLLSTDSHWKTLDVFKVTSFDPPILTAIDFDDETPNVAEGIAVVREPTSVAVHPTQPIALVTVLGRLPGDGGTVFGFDLREKTLGRMILKQPVGPHPDSIAISPDGKYAIVACEAERHPDAPGEVWVIDISNLSPDRFARDGELPAHAVPGLKKLLGMPESEVEPEFVAFDPQSRFAVISCQENNLLLTLDLQTGVPTFGKPIYLTAGAEPDGVSILDNVQNPEGKTGCLVAAAEEGKLSKYGYMQGHSVSFHWLDPNDLSTDATPMSRVDVRSLVKPSEPESRRDPEAVKLAHFAGRTIAVGTTERGDYFYALDLADPTQPRLIDKFKIGDRPEGLILVHHDEDLIAITGDEGGYGPGTLSFVRIHAKN